MTSRRFFRSWCGLTGVVLCVASLPACGLGEAPVVAGGGDGTAGEGVTTTEIGAALHVSPQEHERRVPEAGGEGPARRLDQGIPLSHGFDRVPGDAFSATVLRLGDVRIEGDGALEITPTPSYNPRGELTSAQWRYRLARPLLMRSGGGEEAIDEQPVLRQEGTQVTGLYEGAGVTVRYDHKDRGLEQIVEIARRPVGEDALRVVFEAPAGFEHHQPLERAELEVRYEGRRIFGWQGLTVLDADGQRLEARLEGEGPQMIYHIEDAQARYPLTLDPVATTSPWQSVGLTSSGAYGQSVAMAGDVDNDGFNDLLVGEPFFSSNPADPNQQKEGRVVLYKGSATGLRNTASWSVEADVNEAWMGSDVNTAGDVNGDGFTDIIVGAKLFTDNDPNSGSPQYAGRAYVFLGANTPAGLQTTPAWTYTGTQTGVNAGDRVAGVGDVNCDGLDDVAVGVPRYSYSDATGNTLTSAGRLLVFYGQAGNPGGVQNTPAWSYAWPSTFVGFPSEIATMVNVNDDAAGGNPCYDIVASAAFASATPSGGSTLSAGGQVVVFHGGSTGPSATPDTVLHGTQRGELFGYSVIGAGDVNGDTIDDVVVGAPFFDGAGLTDSGRIALYLGSANGLSDPPADVELSTFNGARFGFSLGASDLDGDGDNDVIVGAPEFTGGQAREGAVFFFLGASAGLVTPPAVTRVESNVSRSNFGFDVAGTRTPTFDGDALGEAVVGARNYVRATDLGAVFVYYGQPQCSIGGVSYPDGATNPAAPCEICDVSASTTMWTVKADATVCDDGDGCTTGTVCTAGTCGGGLPATCDDGDSCTDDMCDPVQGCVNTFRGAGASCDDSDFCTTVDICDANGLCRGTTPRDCSVLDTQCREPARCDSFSGMCRRGVALEDDIPCDDADICTTMDLCQMGSCVGAPKCVDTSAVDCVAERCDQVTGACTTDPVPANAACDAGSLCLVGACDGATNCVGTPRDCDDNNPCTAGTCDATLVGCTPANSGSCCMQTNLSNVSCTINDNLPCTTGQCQVPMTGGASQCAAVIDAAFCVIDNACVAATTRNPLAPCQVCDPSQSQTAWSSAPAGTACADGDGLSCTQGACRTNAATNTMECRPETVADTCAINGACYAANDFNTAQNNLCQVCDPAQSQTMWSFSPTTVQCAPGSCTISNTAVGPSFCDGLGTCTAPMPIACGLFACESDKGLCKATCTGDTDCAADAHCDPATMMCSRTNRAPVADAGMDLTVNAGVSFMLDGTGSSDPDNDPLTYVWTLASGPSNVMPVFSDQTTATPSVLIPREGVNDGDVFYFDLTVSDGTQQATDQVAVTVDAVPNDAPTAVITGPTMASAGSTITLDGTGSSDPDNDPLTYQWAVQSPPGAPAPTVSDREAATLEATFSQLITTETTYTFTLVVNDGRLNSAVAMHDVVVAPRDNEVPVARVQSSPTEVSCGDVVSLRSANSSDADGDDLSFAWTVAATPVDAPEAALDDVDQPTAALTLPEILEVETTYTVTLVVADPFGDSEPATVDIVVGPCGVTPDMGGDMGPADMGGDMGGDLGPDGVGVLQGSSCGAVAANHQRPTGAVSAFLGLLAMLGLIRRRR